MTTTKFHRKAWTREEDEALRKVVEELGPCDWPLVAQRMVGRNSRQCRLRWNAYLNPQLNKAPFTREEDELLFRLVEDVGQKWSYIKQFFDRRADTALRNRYRRLMEKTQKKIEVQCNMKDISQMQKVVDHLNKPFIAIPILFTVPPKNQDDGVLFDSPQEYEYYDENPTQDLEFDYINSFFD